jgi:sodium transport system permease protein
MMRWKSFRVVLGKELLDTLRDRRALIAMVAVPIFLWPVMMLGMGGLIAAQEKKTQATMHEVAIIGSQWSPTLTAAVQAHEGLIVLPAQSDSIEALLRSKDLRAALTLSHGFEDTIAAGGTGTAEILYIETEAAGEVAMLRLDRVTENFADSVANSRLSAAGLDSSVVHPVDVNRRNVATGEELGGFVLGMFLPYLLVIIALTGGLYPAIDLTAGEKERGTMETLLATPATRFELAAGKVFTVFLAAFFAAVLATTSMFVSFSIGASILADAGEISFTVSAANAAGMLLLLIPTAALFAGVLLSIALAARSYKEAQSYLTPLMFLVIIPGFVTFVRGFEPTFVWAFVPVSNVCLSMKMLLAGAPEWGFIAATFGAAFVYATAAVWIASRQFHRESVLFRM